MQKIIRPLFLLTGALLLVWLVRRIGYDTIIDHIREIGWWTLPVIVMSGAWYVTYAMAWRAILAPHKMVDLWEIFRMKLAGEAVNMLTPANFLGGDPVRILLLRRHCTWTHGAASVIIDRTLQSMATLGMVLFGAIIAFWHIPNIPMNIQYGLPVVLFVACGFITFVFIHQRNGLFGFGLHLLKRLRIRRHMAPGTVQQCAEMDQAIAAFYRQHPRPFWVALGYHWASRCLGILEIYLVGHLLDTRFGLTESLILGALAPVINLCFTFIPGAIGVMEGAFGGVLYLLHLPPALGLTIQIVKRIRAGCWIAVGFFFLSTHERHTAQDAPEALQPATLSLRR